MGTQPLGATADALILGRGWSSPITLDAADEIRSEAGAEKVRQSIRLILGTRRGERVMRPDFGAGLEDFLFEPVSTTTNALIRHRVETALLQWEPRIDITEVTVVTTEPRSGRLNLKIGYTIRATNTFYNLVYPFFLHEGGRE
ncbi:GPW/gp25 family protein [Arthrobacter oryzae]|uniref:GPW/gp25 family protein n=1 Tax=Arthrobacter oryzae TaxID=409290 RepID=UPI002781C657|nr:GPW/gp25 family protein [Arthrobacter oryzae]MDQ0079503.1 phage baseplate assembly protein W [Arthrobacter oryzae]